MKRRIWLATAAVCGLTLFLLLQRPPESSRAPQSDDAIRVVEKSASPSSTPSAPENVAPTVASTSSAGANAVSAAPPPAWRIQSVPEGEPLAPFSTSFRVKQLRGEAPKGRSASVTPVSREFLDALRSGDGVLLPLLGGMEVAGRVNLVHRESTGWIRVAGSLENGVKGSFQLASDGQRQAALIQLPDQGLALEVETRSDGRTLLVEKPLSSVVCFPLPRPDDEPVRIAPEDRSTLQATPPLLSSRPNAVAVIYLDFDGEVVTDPAWNNGITINAAASPLSVAEMTEVWNRVKEDYWPFNVDITTQLSRYTSAPVGRRTRIIITPTTTAAPTAGGVAYLYSFARAGEGLYSSTIPAWVFNSTPKSIAEAISHEAGHTFGLQHDGRLSPVESYYSGHGSGAVGWAPIMGNSYTRQLTQWSKGEYANANQIEDDLAVIAGPSNGFGYTADEAGGTTGSAGVLASSAGAINQSGIITQASDTDYYAFNIPSGRVTINAAPAPIAPNLDLEIELQDSSGVAIISANPEFALDAAVSSILPAGTYYLRVRGTGRGDVLGTGYSSYGSIGAYQLTGTLPGSKQAPIITSASAVPGMAGQPLAYQIVASGSPTTYAIVSGILPAGLFFDGPESRVSGTPSAAGVATVVFSATNAVGTGTRAVSFTISPALTLEQALDGPGLTWFTTGSAAWLPETSLAYDNIDAAQSGLIGHGQNSRLTTTVTGPSTVTFRWRADTEANGDIARFSLDGVVQANLSGRTLWEAGTVNVPTGNHTLEWSYTKNAAVSEGADAIWVDQVSVGPPLPPALISPATISGTVGLPLSYQIVAINSPVSYQVITGTIPAGLTLDATTGLISGTPATPQTTSVTLGATSSVGTGTLAVTFSISESNLSLAAALDTPDRTWTSAGASPWLGQTQVTFDGVDAARSGTIGNSQISSMETVVIGPAVISFRWKVDSEEAYDFLTVRDNGAIVAAISGLKDWSSRTVNVPAGTHQIRWAYEKDFVRSVGADAAWVDSVSVTASTTRVLSISGDLAFGSVAVGSSSTQVLTLSNLGNSALTVSGITYPPGFSGAVSGTIPPGASRTLSVTFRPTTFAPYGGTIVVVSDATGGASSRTVSGVGVPAAPANDRLNFASNLLGNSVSSTINNSSATNETGEPEHAGLPGGSSVWWRWTASASGLVSVNTIGSDFDTLLAVYTGSTFGSLVNVASDDESGGSNTSALTFTAVAGTSYLIAVDGFFGDTGLAVLNLATVPDAPNDRFSSSTLLTGNIAQSVGSNANASRETNEPNHGSQFFGRSLWWSWTAPASGRLLIDTNGSNFDTILAVYTGPLVFSLTSVGSDDNSGYGDASALAIPVLGGTTYRIAVEGKGIASGIAVLNLRLVTPPANDKFDNAAPLSGLSAQATGTTIGATRESSEPLHDGITGGSSVWWRWTAPEATRVTVSTANSSFDTLLAVYSGSNIDALTPIASNDEASIGVSTSRVAFSATAGTTYWIAVDGYFGDAGTINLSLNAIVPPANDVFAAATILTGLATQVTGTNAGSNKESGEPNHAGWTGGGSVWWKWTAPSASRTTLSTAGSNFDTLLGVYTGSSVNALTLVASNDEDGPIGVDISALTFDATAGTTYWIVVDGYGGATGSITLTMTGEALLPPTITTQPLSQAVTVGQNVAFTLTVSGTSPMAFQWRKDGVAIPGFTSATLAFVDVQASSAGSYSVVVTNPIGSVTSSPAILTVNSAAVIPTITTQPVSQTVIEGQSVTFSVLASGTAPLAYQWKKNGVVLASATASTLTLPAVALTDAGSYSVTVTNAAGSITSATASLTINPAIVAPAITTQPVSITLVTGQTATFSVIASGTAPLMYQWRRDGTPIPGAVESTYTLANVQASNAGAFSVVVTNASGNVTSASATLTVSPAPIGPIILTAPAGRSVVIGQGVTLSVVVTGTPPFLYQWKKNGGNILGATGSSLVFGQVQETDSGDYSVAITNAVGTVTSATATLTVTAAITTPSITQQPVSQVVAEGTSAMFSVIVAGSAPFTFQWRRDGVAIPGATSSSLTLAAAKLNDNGAYSVVVGNAGGTATSTAATLTVNPAAVAPSIIAPPQGLTVVQGESATFTVVAQGTAPLTYTWLFNGTAIPLAAGDRFTLPSAQISDQGGYAVTVTNAAGSVTSEPVQLIVTPTVSSRISNVSVRTTLAAEQALIVGLTMSGGEKSILVRAVGPGLAPFGVTDSMPDPQLGLYDGTQLIESNDNWGGGSALRTSFGSVGAFALSGDSKDAALVRTVQGGRTVQITGRSAGGVLVEGYDAGTGNTSRLTNVSARNRVGSGGDILIAGITISGSGSKSVLIRAVGPTLAEFGVPGVLVDPKLEVYSGSTKIEENDNWSVALATRFAAIGAFALVPGSKDAALMVSLPPGGYTIQVRGADGGTGEGLIEVYELEP